MNDERFFDLTMKAIAKQATDAERAELDALLAREPAIRAEFARLQANARLTRGALPLVDAIKAAGDKLPAYARGRLQTKVQQTLGRPAAKREPDRSLAWGWRWVLGLAAATAVVVLVALPTFRTPGPVVQVAMLDTAGVVRGSDTNETEILKQQWNNSTIRSFDKTDLLDNWETNWPAGNKITAKVIYDRAAGEVRVLILRDGKIMRKVFFIDQDLAATLRESEDFIREESK